MSDWKKKNYPAGTPVRVQDIHGKDLGVGTLLTDYHEEEETENEEEWVSISTDAPDFKEQLTKAIMEMVDPDEIPEIRLADGTIIQGSECWWTPVEEVENEPHL